MKPKPKKIKKMIKKIKEKGITVVINLNNTELLSKIEEVCQKTA